MILKVFDRIDLDKNPFREVNLKGANDFYLISITKDKNIKSVVFEVAIDSGVKGKPLQLPNIKLELDGKNEVSGVRVLNHPSEFYIRPVQVTYEDGHDKACGKFDIEVNLNAQDLG